MYTNIYSFYECNIVEFQECLAGFLLEFKNSKAAWYSLVDVDENIPNLSSLLSTKESNIVLILVEMGMGIVKKGVFCFNKQHFDDFVDRFHLQQTI